LLKWLGGQDYKINCKNNDNNNNSKYSRRNFNDELAATGSTYSEPHFFRIMIYKWEILRRPN